MRSGSDGHRRSRPSSLSGTGPRPTSAGTFLAHGLAIADLARATDRVLGVVLVPDGVASIRVGPFVSARNAAPPGISARALGAALAAIRATAPVHENIGAFGFAIPVVSGGRTGASPPARRPGLALFGMPTNVQDTWLDARGHVIKRTTTRIDLIVRVQLRGAR